MKKYRAVLFDLDNTLIDRDRAFEQWLEEEAPASFHVELRGADRGGQGDRETFFELWKQRTGMEIRQSDLVEGLLRHLQPDQNILSALEALSRTHLIGIVTNGGSESQRRKIVAAGIDRVFPWERIWISEDVGVAKPDPYIFELACEALHVSPADGLYIGDTDEIDGLGARRAGMGYANVTRLIQQGNSDWILRLCHEA